MFPQNFLSDSDMTWSRSRTSDWKHIVLAICDVWSLQSLWFASSIPSSSILGPKRIVNVFTELSEWFGHDPGVGRLTGSISCLLFAMFEAFSAYDSSHRSLQSPSMGQRGISIRNINVAGCHQRWIVANLKCAEPVFSNERQKTSQ